MRFTDFRVALAATALMLSVDLPITRPAAAALDPDLANLVASLLPSCVNITTTRYKEVQVVEGKSVFVQVAESDKRRFYGSGFIITPDGYVVTNKHVTRNGISYVVTLVDGRQFPADLVAQAVANDIAVIRIRSSETWTPVKLGDSDKIRRGDAVIAIGNPFGYQSTVTAGIISALNRDLGYTEFDDYMQTDAAINPGNSGGPLFNRNGEVIGVNTALDTSGDSTGSVGIGLVIPINDAEFAVRHMKDPLDVTKNWRPAYLGATIQSLTPNLAAAYGLPGPWGSIIASVADDGPAAQAQLRAGDIITSFDGKDRRDSRALMRSIVETQAGTTAELGVWRDGKLNSIRVNLTGYPAGQSLPVDLGGGGVPRPDIPPEALMNFGLQLSPITLDLRSKYTLDQKLQGVVVTAVAIGSAAADLAIDAGAVILKVGDSSVSLPEDIFQRVADERRQRHSFVPMLIWDSSGSRWVAFNLN